VTTPANLRGWGQGWPTNRSRDMLTVRTARSNVPFTVHRDIAPIVKYLIDEVERRGYMIHTPGQTPDDWSYANRAIRGRNRPSNHSWGLAIDIDATQFPLGSRKRLPSWIVELFRAHGFDYGGDWTRRPDPMHFEFAGWPSDARRIREQILRYPTAGSPATPPKPSLIPQEDDDMYIRDRESGAIYALSATHWDHLSGPQWEDRKREGARAQDMHPLEVLARIKSRIKVG